jgi:hypothetical protein
MMVDLFFCVSVILFLCLCVRVLKAQSVLVSAHQLDPSKCRLQAVVMVTV